MDKAKPRAEEDQLVVSDWVRARFRVRGGPGYG